VSLADGYHTHHAVDLHRDADDVDRILALYNFDFNCNGHHDGNNRPFYFAFYRNKLPASELRPREHWR
jgi:hypothetical protein